MLLQIIAHTPIWVWFLFVGLVVLGLSQTRRRSVSLGRLLIAPVALSALSLQGVLGAFSSNVPALLLWPVGAAAVTGLMLQLPDSTGTRYKPATGRFDIEGSWVPLTLMMAIFCGKYAMGVSLVMMPQLASQTGFALPVCLLNGAISGIFIGRVVRLMRLRAAVL